MFKKAAKCLVSILIHSAVAGGAAAVCGSMLACVLVGKPEAIPVAMLFLSLFIIFDLWPLLAGLGLWIGCFPPKRLRGWSQLLLAVSAAGLLASWRFQTVRPWDWYHEGDGSRPGWVPVRMASLTTAISLAGTYCGVLAPILLRRLIAVAEKCRTA